MRPFLFLLFPALLLGCPAPESPESSEPPTQPLNIQFSDTQPGSSDVSDGRSIIGMRAFLLTVRITKVSQKVLLNFIVGESQSPPEWSAVKDSPARLTRAFSPQQSQRSIYFSATDKYRAIDSAHEVDFDGQADEVDYTRTQAPGIMIPGQTYYVHVFSQESQGQARYLKSQMLTTAAYPTTGFPAQHDGTSNGRQPTDGKYYISPYMWGMDGWKEPGVSGSEYENSRFSGIEVNPDELYLLPARLLFPLNQPPGSNSPCFSPPLNLLIQIAPTDDSLTAVAQYAFRLQSSAQSIGKPNYRFLNTAHVFSGTPALLSSTKSLEFVDAMLPLTQNTMSAIVKTGNYVLEINFACLTAFVPYRYGRFTAISE